MKKWVAMSALSLLLTGNNLALAQTMMNTSTMTLGMQQMSQSAFMSNSIFNSNAAIDMMRRDLRRGRSSSSKAAGGNFSTQPLTAGSGTRLKSGDTPTVNNSTTFRPVAESIVPAKFGALMKSPEKGREMAKAFADHLAYHRGKVREVGIPQNDVAQATSFFIIRAYGVAMKTSLSASQAEAVRRDVREYFQASPHFRQASDREKQETYETMAILGEFISVGYQSGVILKNKEIQSGFQDLAKDQLERFLGAPLRDIKFTDQGIEY